MVAVLFERASRRLLRIQSRTIRIRTRLEIPFFLSYISTEVLLLYDGEREEREMKAYTSVNACERDLFIISPRAPGWAVLIAHL